MSGNVTHGRPRVRKGLDLLDDVLQHLPLLALAGDLAEHQPRRRLIVGARELPAATGGGVVDVRFNGTAIVLDPAQCDLETTFAHELAHLLDPDFLDGRLHAGNRTAVIAWNRRERFANTLGPMLLAGQPTSCDATSDLVRLVYRVTKRGRGGGRVSIHVA